MILVGNGDGGSAAPAVGLVVMAGLTRMEVLVAVALRFFAITDCFALDITRRLNKNV